MGFDNIFFMSSMSGSGSGELLDALTELMPEEKPEDGEEEEGKENELPRVCYYRANQCWQIFFAKCVGRKRKNLS
jgi:predicted GTPase